MVKKINIILDLDNTLLNSISPQEIQALPKNIKTTAKLDNHNNKLVKYIDMDDVYRVYLRPHLDQFLDYLFKNFNVSVWTAASKEYASFIIDKIILRKPNRKLDYVFYSYHCDKSKKYMRCTKDLSMLWSSLKLMGYNKDNTYIIDDLSELNETMPEHVFPADYFDILEDDAGEDDFLLRMIDELKKLKG